MIKIVITQAAFDAIASKAAWALGDAAVVCLRALTVLSPNVG